MNDSIYAICARMREIQDFSALPILSDALQEANFPEELVNRCRNPPESWAEQTRLVAEVMGGEAWEAVLWIDEFCAELGAPGEYWWTEEDRKEHAHEYGDPPLLDYKRLVEVLRSNEGSDDSYVWKLRNDWISFYGYDTPDRCHVDRAKMWEMYYLATGRLDTGDHGSVFSCSC